MVAVIIIAVEPARDTIRYSDERTRFLLWTSRPASALPYLVLSSVLVSRLSAHRPSSVAALLLFFVYVHMIPCGTAVSSSTVLASRARHTYSDKTPCLRAGGAACSRMRIASLLMSSIRAGADTFVCSTPVPRTPVEPLAFVDMLDDLWA
ncbi:hypothetical protein C8R45DRAFT_1151540 [Mycena sanguinolenta]|nr:hypothetical protein C8R45DRAFT_1151540 [Mycena sanguinolenta]